MGARAQTIDIDKPVTLTDETISDLEHVPETYAETNLLEDLFAKASMLCPPRVRRGSSAYAIRIFLVDVVFERAIVALSKILGTDLDQVGHCSLRMEISSRTATKGRIQLVETGSTRANEILPG